MYSGEAKRLGEKEGLKISKTEDRCTGRKPKAKEIVARRVKLELN